MRRCAKRARRGDPQKNRGRSGPTRAKGPASGAKGKKAAPEKLAQRQFSKNIEESDEVVATGLAMWALWWYISSGLRLVEPALEARVVRRNHLISSGAPLSTLVLMVVVLLGVGHFINPVVLAYLVALGYVALGVIEGREPASAEVEQPLVSGAKGPEDEAPEDEGRSESPGHASE